MPLSREERLAAWLDGELHGTELEAFEAELAADPELRTLADEWGANDALIAGAFAPVAEAPIDAAMLERLGLVEPAPIVVPPPPPSLAANDNAPWWKRHALPLGGAIAASLAAALVLATRGGSPDRDPLSLALDRTPSLASAELPDGRKITPALTARAADGRWCREFGDSGKVALACRDTKGAPGTGGVMMPPLPLSSSPPDEPEPPLPEPPEPESSDPEPEPPEPPPRARPPRTRTR